jgi:hypothetical protein
LKATIFFAVARSAAIFLVAGCTSGPVVVPPDTSESLRAPVSQTVFLEAVATGVQIYECASRPEQPSAFEWVFKAPDAGLFDASGQSIGKHYAGPTWESNDGSLVVGEIKWRDPGPNPSAIPWLLLTAKSTSGTGVLSQTKSIQRVQTAGGITPDQPCGTQNANQIARVPYSAKYYFYR